MNYSGILFPIAMFSIGVSIRYFYNPTKIADKNKGMYIWIGDDKYPNLMLVLGDTLGIFDKNFTDYIGKPTYELINGPNTYNFENMSKDDFISTFGKALEDFKKNPEDIYYKYRSFSIQQITVYEQSINTSMTKEDFVKKYESFYDELREHVKGKTGEGVQDGIEITAGNAYDVLFKKDEKDNKETLLLKMKYYFNKQYPTLVFDDLQKQRDLCSTDDGCVHYKHKTNNIIYSWSFNQGRWIIHSNNYQKMLQELFD
jgi:hypothetical protein